ncbi:hypothetical protein CYK57_00100 [Actinobacillus pleuropneumoniae]|nr:hypothetical protein CYK57_00100 [Actinobacillus pleuropneumoniae]
MVDLFRTLFFNLAFLFYQFFSCCHRELFIGLHLAFPYLPFIYFLLFCFLFL